MMTVGEQRDWNPATGYPRPMPKTHEQTNCAACPAFGPIFTFSPLHQRTLTAKFFPMSALSEASTPAQEAASASIDTQQLHQLHNGDPSQQQQPGQNGSASVNESGRKRALYILLQSAGI
jgi:hypothetical protein